MLTEQQTQIDYSFEKCQMYKTRSKNLAKLLPGETTVIRDNTMVNLYKRVKKLDKIISEDTDKTSDHFKINLFLVDIAYRTFEAKVVEAGYKNLDRFLVKHDSPNPQIIPVVNRSRELIEQYMVKDKKGTYMPRI